MCQAHHPLPFGSSAVYLPPSTRRNWYGVPGIPSIRYLAIDFEREEKNCGYQIKVSTDASAWQTVVTKPTSRNPRWGGPTQIFHDMDAKARYVRIEFTEMLSGTWASIKEFAVYPQAPRSRRITMSPTRIGCVGTMSFTSRVS